jgi:hypothetical protein
LARLTAAARAGHAKTEVALRDEMPVSLPPPAGRGLQLSTDRMDVFKISCRAGGTRPCPLHDSTFQPGLWADTFPRRRLVKFYTKRFRGNAADIVVSATTRVGARIADEYVRLQKPGSDALICTHGCSWFRHHKRHGLLRTV